MKRCTICKQEKPFSEFNKKTASKDGLQSACRECSHKRFKVHYEKYAKTHRVRVKQNNKDRRNQIRVWLVNYLETHPCVDCGETDIRVLEFDHLPQYPKFKEVTRLISGAYSMKIILAEIDKCEVRCRNHHAIKTYERMGGSWHDNFLVALEHDG